MYALTGERLLNAWDQGQLEPEVTRAIVLLASALPSHSTEELALMPLAERNALLLELRALSFGHVMDGYALCPECAGALEFQLAVKSLLEQTRAKHTGESLGSEIHMRQANTMDLLACLQEEDAEAGRHVLLRRCGGGQELSTEVIERFEVVNSSAEMLCRVECPECGGQPVLDFDIAAFLWREVRSAAKQLLWEIHCLAAAYGWNQAEIFALTPQRRQAYLEMVSA
jgi:hypothetical protein